MKKTILTAAAPMLVLAGAIGAAHADLVISKKATANVDCESGICNATAADAVLNVKDLAAMLAASDVKVFAQGPATDITLTAPLRWVSANRLTLGAYGSLNVKAAISVAGSGALTINTNVAGSGGVFQLVGVGQISFWDTSSSLVINNTPYTLIGSVPDLIAAVAANPSGTYAFADDYDAHQDGNYAHSPVQTDFTGVLEGLGNTIKNLGVYNSNANQEKIALFAELDTAGQISDLNLAAVSMQSEGGELAPLVAVNLGTIAHASAGGTIFGANDAAAGLVYDNQGTIARSHSTVGLSDNDGAGGLVATNEGTIQDSFASGSVSSTSYSGGLVAVSTGTIVDSYALGAVAVTSYDDAAAGGLVGYFTGTIEQCFATGDVEGGFSDPAGKAARGKHKTPFKGSGMWLGGLAGSVYYSSGTIRYSYATGTVRGDANHNEKNSSVGGLIGQADGLTIYQGYALGKLAMNAKKFIGGVIGSDGGFGNYTAAFWDRDTTGVDFTGQGAGNVYDDPGLKGFPDKNFRRNAMASFDTGIWAEDGAINNGYPYLIANPPPK